MDSDLAYSGVKILQISQICHRKKVNSVLTSFSVIVEFIDIPSNFENIMLIIIIKEYRSMMCNTLNMIIESVLTICFKVN